jgi:hypothetical protein
MRLCVTNSTTCGSAGIGNTPEQHAPLRRQRYPAWTERHRALMTPII